MDSCDFWVVFVTLQRTTITHCWAGAGGDADGDAAATVTGAATVAVTDTAVSVVRGIAGGTADEHSDFICNFSNHVWDTNLGHHPRQTRKHW